MGVCYVASAVRMHVDSSGRIRAKHGSAAYKAWSPFVDAFGSVVILARVEQSVPQDDGTLVEGAGVSVRALPYYHGASATPLGVLRIRRFLQGVGSTGDFFIGRVPEIISLEVLRRARVLGAKNLAMVVAEPETIQHVLPRGVGALAAPVVRSQVKKAISGASAVSYVSQSYFQDRLPAPIGAPTIGRSNVLLDDKWFVSSPKNGRDQDKLLLVSVGHLHGSMKGMDFLINVLRRLRGIGVTASLTVVGDGVRAAELRRQAAEARVEVAFVGHVHSRDRLRELLDHSHVYVSGSRSEGLPRATVEAMARGLPVVTTDAGAISEIVDPPYHVPIGDEEAFVDSLVRLAEDGTEYKRQSEKCLSRAREVSKLAEPKRFTSFLRTVFEQG